MPEHAPVDRRRWLSITGLVAARLALGCAGEGGGAVGRGGGGFEACVGTPVVTPKRVVRLSEHQLFNSYASLFGASAAATITRDEESAVAARARIPAHQR